MPRRLSDEGAAFIAREEGAIRHWYRDALGHWTIGIGHLGDPSVEFPDVATEDDLSRGRLLTDSEMWDLFRTDAARYVESVDRLVTVGLTQRQFDMLVDFAFNWGIGEVGGFPATSILRLVNAGDLAGVARELVDGRGPPTKQWPQGRPYDKGLAGVRARRRREAEAFQVEGGTAVTVVKRAEWGARPPNGFTRAPGMTRGVGVHWLGDGQGPTNHSQCPAKMREIQSFHMGPQRGWADFAYNAAVCMHGTVFEGRGPRIRNAANGGGTRHGIDANAGWASVLYVAGSDGPPLTDEAKDGINDAAEYLSVADKEWLGHRDFLSTECPGNALYEWVHAGHPRANAKPRPKPQRPEPEDDMAGLFIFDGPPERGGGVYYSDGRTKWGVPVEPALAFFATGKVPHLGTVPVALFDALPWNHPYQPPSAAEAFGVEADRDAPDAVEANASDPTVTIAGSLAEAMEASDFETGDPHGGV